MTTYEEIEPLKEQVINDYKIGLFTYEICKKYEISFKLLNKCLNKWGVQRRGRGISLKKYNIKYTDENLIEGLKAFAKKIGKTPTYQEMENVGPFSGWTYKARFGSWNNAINIAGLEKEKRRREGRPKGRKKVSDEELLGYLQDLFLKYKRPPTDLMLRKEKTHTSKVYKARFGSIKNARRKAGINESKNFHKIIRDEELIAEIQRLYKVLRRVPTAQDIYDYGKHSFWCYVDRFGSLENVFKIVGISPNEERKKEYLKEIMRLSNVLGHAPTMKDMLFFGKYHPTTYYNYFSSWIEMLSSVGLLPTRYHIISRDGHVCRSNEEVMIDDFLFSHGIQHEREPPYPNSLMKADWLIKNRIYVEYFGLIKFPRYKKRVKRKLEIINKENIPFIEILPEDLKNLEDKFACILK